MQCSYSSLQNTAILSLVAILRCVPTARRNERGLYSHAAGGSGDVTVTWSLPDFQLDLISRKIGGKLVSH